MMTTTPTAVQQADELVYRVSERVARYLRRHGDTISVRYAAIEAGRTYRDITGGGMIA